MEGSIAFKRFRAIAFSCIISLGFVWITLLSVCAYLRWDGLDRPERSFLTIMLLTNSGTVITLLVLLLRNFRIWIDAVRCLFLLIVHIGVAGVFAYWSPDFKYTAQSHDQEAWCKLITLYIMISSWVVPTLVTLYIGGLAYVVHRRSLISALEEEAIKVPAHHKARDQYFPPVSPVTSTTMNWDQRTTLSSSPVTITFPPEAILYMQRRLPKSSTSSHRSSLLRMYSIPERH